MKKSVLAIIAVLVLSTNATYAQRYGGARTQSGRIENTHGRTHNEIRAGNRAPHNNVAVYPEHRNHAPAPVMHRSPAPVRVVHHPVRPVVVHRPAPVYVGPAYVAPAPPVHVVHSSTAAGIVAGAVVGTVIGALLCN